MNGSSGRRIPPIVMGHEAAGVIAALGAGVSDWKIGERVTFDSTEYCGSCEACVEGKFNICQNRKVLGVSCKDYRRHGCFAEYVALPTRILHRIPDSLSFEKAAFAEPVAIALHAVDLAPRPRSEKSCAVVVGAGLIGLLVIQSLRTRGWQHIIAVDLDAGRLAIACDLGASKGISARDENALQQIRDSAGADGAEAAWEVVGAAAPFDLAVRAVQKNGNVVLVGNLQASVAFPLQEVVTRLMRLCGRVS
jgi:L-iditol 2-dehydrogenase